MNLSKSEIQKEIKAAEENLKSLREKLEEPEFSAGDILKSYEDPWPCMVLPDGRNVILKKHRTGQFGLLSIEQLKVGGYKRIGTFSEVFTRNDEIEKAIDDILEVKDDSGDMLEYCSDCNLEFEESGVKKVVDKLRELRDLVGKGNV